MGIWIKSQKKDALLFCDLVEVNGNHVYGNEYLLGKYDTEERALEVLELVVDRIIKGSKFDEMHSNKRTTRDFVFQMPEK